MTKTRHLAISIALSFLILVTGTTGYMLIEDWRFLDALYMTIITISTVGYREVNQDFLCDGGCGSVHGRGARQNHNGEAKVG
jgi:hypothetical protein